MCFKTDGDSVLRKDLKQIYAEFSSVFPPLCKNQTTIYEKSEQFVCSVLSVQDIRYVNTVICGKPQVQFIQEENGTL